MLTIAAIEACWPTIEAFTDLESTISLSSTCRSLHSLLFDAPTRKVKVSHFHVCNLPHLSYSRNIIAIPQDYTTAHLRIPHFTSRALNHIHFSSLSRLHLDFPLTRRATTGDDRSDYLEDVHTSAFPMFASQLGACANNSLTSLYLNCNRLLQHEKVLEGTYEIFGQNLSRCCPKLEELTIVNTGIVRGENSTMYSVALAKALVSTLKKRRDHGLLRKFHYEAFGRPLLFHHRSAMVGRVNNEIVSKVNQDLFSAALQLANLEEFSLRTSWGGAFCDFLAVVVEAMAEKQNDSTKKPSSSIRELEIECFDWIREENAMATTSVCPMFEYFSDCRSLERLQLELPSQCWRESQQTLEALKRMLKDKTELRHVSISLERYDDRAGNVFKSLSEMSTHILKSCNIICFRNIYNVDEIELNKLFQSMEMLGFEKKYIKEEAGADSTHYMRFLRIRNDERTVGSGSERKDGI